MKRDKQLTLDDIADEKHIEKSILLACKGKRDRKNVQKLIDEAKPRAKNISRRLKEGTYQVGRYNEFDICERGKDRHIQHLYLIDPDESDIPPDQIGSDGGMLRAVVEKIEPDMLDYLTENTHAAIKHHGTHLALKQERSYLLSDPEGTKYCYKCDIRKFFPSIDRAILKRMFRRLWKDPELLALLDHIVDSAPGDKGIPIGNHPSQLFANIYLGRFDHWVQNILGVKYYIRYMDDIVILAGSKEELRRYHREIEWYLMRNLNLEIKANWQIFPVESRGIDFVGYRVWNNRVLLRKKTLLRTRKDCKKIRNNLLVYDKFTSRDRDVLASRAGALAHCTPKVRNALYVKYIKSNLDLLSPAQKPRIKWYEHTHKSRSAKHTPKLSAEGQSPALTPIFAMSQTTKNIRHQKDSKISHSSELRSRTQYGMPAVHHSMM